MFSLTCFSVGNEYLRKKAGGGMNLDPEYLVNMKDLGLGGSTWRFGLWLDLIFGGSGSQVTNFEHLQQDSQFLQGGPRTDK